MTPREIVAKWIEAEWLSHEPVLRAAEEEIIAGLVIDIEQAIIAAVEEERETCAQIAEEYTGKPHQWIHETGPATAAKILLAIRARSNASHSAGPMEK